jgi:hypothetical protein
MTIKTMMTYNLSSLATNNVDTSTQHLKLDAGQYEGMMKMKIMLLGQGKSTEAKPMSLAMVPPPTI